MIQKIAKTVFSLSLLLLVLVPEVHAARPQKRMIVLGFDGVDAQYTEKWMNEGKLPHLAKLREQGTFRPLRPTVPAQTPVSWSTFTTGIDPGRTGIFDFLRRDPKNYLPVFAAFDESSEPFFFGKGNRLVAAAAAFAVLFVIVFIVLKLFRLRAKTALMTAVVLGVIGGAAAFVVAMKFLPLTRPTVISRRQGIPFWHVLSDNGYKVSVMRMPVTFPAESLKDGREISGLGVPDLSGRIGKPFYFTSELDLKHDAGSNEFSIEVVQLEDNKGVIHTSIVGPPNKLFGNPPYISCPMTITVAPDRNSVQIEVSGQKFTVKQGQWSGWTNFEFAFNPIVKVHGVSRFFVLSTQPEVRMYLSPINFDPRALPPGFKISEPASWAKEVADKYGLYKTIGWATDTWAISEGFANEQMFWDDMEWTVSQFKKQFEAELKGDDALLVHYFEFPDRVAHVFWRFMDPQHPAYDAQLAAKWGDGLLRSYQMMDTIVGEAMDEADKENIPLIVVSDHGFQTWRKSVNYNTWLAQNGYLGLKTGVEAKQRNLEILFDQGQFWENVDWSKTRAYALGLGDVYINLKGREAHGTVEPGAEYDALKQELKQRLEALVDVETGAHPVYKVYTREEIYRKFDPNLIPDLFATNSAGYRVSWQTSLGGVQKNLFEVNKAVWSGDHCSVNPELVKGVFFTNRKLATDRPPYIADIYPTVLDYFGVKPPYELDGVALK